MKNISYVSSAIVGLLIGASLVLADSYTTPGISSLIGGFTGGSGTVNVLAAWQTGGTAVGNSNPAITCDGTNCTLASGQLLVPDGTAVAPFLARSADTDQGFVFGANTVTYQSTNGTDEVRMDTAGVIVPANASFGWSGSNLVASGPKDPLIGRHAAGSIRLGADAVTATAQTIKSHDITSTTDVAGPEFILSGGAGRGNAASPGVSIRVPFVAASGTTLQTITEVADFTETGLSLKGAAGTLASTRTTDIGWTVQSAANQACNTTCTNACVIGFEITATVTTAVVACTDATADSCLCAGTS